MKIETIQITRVVLTGRLAQISAFIIRHNYELISSTELDNGEYRAIAERVDHRDYHQTRVDAD
jgi:hypothetical protein